MNLTLIGAPNLFFIQTTIVRRKKGKPDHTWPNASPIVFPQRQAAGRNAPSLF